MLTDLSTYKRTYSLYTTNSDQKLSLLIADQSQAFLDETGRTTFDLATYTETRDGLGNDTMQLSYFPVQSFTSLVKNGVTIPLSTGWNKWGYQWDSLGKVTLICDSFNCSNVTFNRKNVVATYTAGYPTLTVTNELQTVPNSLPPGPAGTITTWPPLYTIFVALPNWLSDGGVSYFGGAVLTPVTAPPTIGQYYVLGGGGYLFAAADGGKQVTMNYTASGYPVDLVGAVTRMVSLRYKQQDHEDLKQVKSGEQTTTFSKEAYPADVVRIIKKYKKFYFTPGF
jgi:hypothetical protein